jgi:hypothetical protein
LRKLLATRSDPHLRALLDFSRIDNLFVTKSHTGVVAGVLDLVHQAHLQPSSC